MRDDANAFTVRTTWAPPGASILLTGELDLAGLPILHGAVLTVLALSPLPSVVRFDIRELHFVDVIGARALLDARARVSRVARAELVGGNTRVAEVLQFVQRVGDPAPGARSSGQPGPNGDGQRLGEEAGSRWEP